MAGQSLLFSALVTLIVTGAKAQDVCEAFIEKQVGMIATGAAVGPMSDKTCSFRSTDVWGRLICCGAAEFLGGSGFASHGSGCGDGSTFGVYVSGSLEFANGQVFSGGPLAYGNNSSVTDGGHSLCGKVSANGQHNCAKILENAEAQNAMFCNLPSEDLKLTAGTLEIPAQSSVHSPYRVYRLSGALLSGTNTVSGSLLGGLTVINVFGKVAEFKNMGMLITGPRNTLLWNFCGTELIQAESVSILGSVLGPRAVFLGINGNIEGQVVVGAFEGTTEFHGGVPVNDFTPCKDSSPTDSPRETSAPKESSPSPGTLATETPEPTHSPQLSVTPTPSMTPDATETPSASPTETVELGTPTPSSSSVVVEPESTPTPEDARASPTYPPSPSPSPALPTWPPELEGVPSIITSCNPLGDYISAFNLFLTGNTDRRLTLKIKTAVVEGAVASCGNVQVDGDYLKIAEYRSLVEGDECKNDVYNLIVDGTLSWNATMYETVFGPGRAAYRPPTMDERGASVCGDVGYRRDMFDCGFRTDEIMQVNSVYCATEDTGRVRLADGNLILEGRERQDDLPLYFSVTTQQLVKARSIVPVRIGDRAVVINVRPQGGQRRTAYFRNLAMGHLDPASTVWNFCQVRSAVIEGPTHFRGISLAPNVHLRGRGGSMDGTQVFGSFEGSTDFRARQLRDICRPPVTIGRPPVGPGPCFCQCPCR